MADSPGVRRWRWRVLSGLIGVAVALFVLHCLGPRLFLRALPDAPDIALPKGSLPDHRVAFEVWNNADTVATRVGSGFFLRLPDGMVIGVTAGHTTKNNAGQFRPTVFMQPNTDEVVASFSRVAAPIGNWQDGGTAGDYLLMRADTPPAEALVLAADPRGAPQLGERLVVFSGVDKPSNAHREQFSGIAENVEIGSVIVRMDSLPSPGMMSGSPVLSAHTGKVVGILVSGYWQFGRLTGIGVNPIAIILAAARQSQECVP